MSVIFDIIACFFIALLSGMGVGSAGLLVAWLTATTSISQLAAQGLNLYFFLFSAGASLIVHIQKRKIFWNIALLMICIGSVGTLAGSLLSAQLSADILRRAFGGMLVFCGLSSLYSVIRVGRTKKSLEK
jgi:uncharacterized membrane protein YfcA